MTKVFPPDPNFAIESYPVKSTQGNQKSWIVQQPIRGKDTGPGWQVGDFGNHALVPLITVDLSGWAGMSGIALQLLLLSSDILRCRVMTDEGHEALQRIKIMWALDEVTRTHYHTENHLNSFPNDEDEVERDVEVGVPSMRTREQCTKKAGRRSLIFLIACLLIAVYKADSHRLQHLTGRQIWDAH
ncbi:hypothetical protein B0H13DRAFT_1910069 [Mycena leptocephala]|nr:hypothetical protein B0H13DRAFT_1910069 [Mycena leptocephala]